jgi:hypothetical protein
MCKKTEQKNLQASVPFSRAQPNITVHIPNSYHVIFCNDLQSIDSTRSLTTVLPPPPLRGLPDRRVAQEEQGLLSPEKEAALSDSNDGTAGSGGLAISLRMVGKVKLGQIRGLVTSIDVKSVDSVETSPPTSRSLIDCT